MIKLVREIGTTVAEFWSDRVGRLSLLAAVSVIVTATVFYRLVEGWSWVDSLYFTVITLTTVGYGDLVPTSPGSKLFTVLLILTGVGLILALINAIATRTGQRHRDRDSGTD